ncbi:MAG: efflux RND transporter periplasmic adaptor subunit [Thiotrichales bacterium]|nr:efflux RND transporter periplasmic adaptor subunit [Thiotrichales bacterium]
MTVNSGMSRTFSGIAKSSQESNLSFKIAGTIEHLPVEVGDTLEAGQTIARLDASQYQLEAQRAQADLAQAQATLRNAEAAFDRVKGLYENNNASRNDLDSARASAESSGAQVSASRKALELAQLNVSYAELRAAEPCSVAHVSVDMNENVSAGQDIVMVTCGDRLEIDIAVPESLISGIERDMSVDVIFPSIPGQQFTGSVIEVGVASTGDGTTFPVSILLNEKSENLRSGLAAQVKFEFGNGDSVDRITVPPVAVGEDTHGRYVYVLVVDVQSGQGVVQRRPVKTGELTPSGLEIIDGLEQGEELITAGVNVIRDGLKVKLEK